MTGGLIGEMRRLRRERGLTKKQLAKAGGFNEMSIARWERGENVPGLLNWEAVINALGYKVKLEPMDERVSDGLRQDDEAQRRGLQGAARARGPEA